MLLRILGIGILTVLVGCATAKETYLPDGSKGYNISCDGNMNNMGDCFQKAGELCGAKGYSVLNREGEAIPLGSSTGGPAGYISQYGMMVTRSLFIKCKE